MRAATSPGRPTGAAIGCEPTRSSSGRAAPTGCTTGSVTGATARAGPSNVSIRDGSAGPAARRGGQRVDEGDGVGHRTGLVPVGPQRTRSADAGRELELHTAAARAVHRIARVQT